MIGNPSVVARVFIVFIGAYRRFVSPMLPPSCRFTPSCSIYTMEAIRKYGAIKGSAMGVWRILRCNPFSRGGMDPVK